MRRARNSDTHSLKQHRLSQNSFPVCSSFVLGIASDMHLELESENREKNVHFHTAKNTQRQPTLFRFFLDEFLETDLRPSYCGLTTCWDAATACSYWTWMRVTFNIPLLATAQKPAVSRKAKNTGNDILGNVSARQTTFNNCYSEFSYVKYFLLCRRIKCG